MITLNHQSPCHYLFRKEASQLYDSSKFSDEFVNQSLDTLMRINILFLTRKENDGFPFIDPAAFNNQCHLYALFAAKIKKGYKEKTDEEKAAKTEENRFLHLSFLLSYTFLTDRNLLLDVINAASKKDQIQLPQPEKLFTLFAKDSDGKLIRASRACLNDVFKRCIKDSLNVSQERSALHKELYQLSLENLHIHSDSRIPALYTLPKLAGVAYLIHENIAFVIKAKVITKEGTGTLIYKSAPKEGDDPVLIFEAIASDELSIDQFRKIAERCPSFFERKPSSKNRHSEKEICQFCNPVQINQEPYQARFQKATESIQESLYALGADFINEVQPQFIKYFTDKNNYPHLSEIFDRATCNIRKTWSFHEKASCFYCRTCACR